MILTVENSLGNSRARCLSLRTSLHKSEREPVNTRSARILGVSRGNGIICYKDSCYIGIIFLYSPVTPNKLRH